MKDLEEYKQWLTYLVFNLKDEEFMHQVDSYGFPKDLLVSIPNSPYGNFPIFGITQCWESSLGEVKEWGRNRCVAPYRCVLTPTIKLRNTLFQNKM